MADSTPPSDADIIDELASIVIRVSDLIQLATTGPYNSRSPNKIAKRLRRMGKQEEAKELEMLIADYREFGDEFAADWLHRQIKDLARVVIFANIAITRSANHLLIIC